MRYAGFWFRVLASVIDMPIYFVISMLLDFVIGFMFGMILGTPDMWTEENVLVFNLSLGI